VDHLKAGCGFLLLVPVEECLRRPKLKNEAFPNSEDVLRQRLALYYELYVLYKLHPIDCLQPIEVVQDEIVVEVERGRW
jgi:thymidylate kinase